MKAQSRSTRDQDETPFSSILNRLVHATGAKSAALVDAEGETVDYSGRGEPFDIRILAAEWRLILKRLGETSVLGDAFELVVRSQKKSYLVESLPDGYALVVELGRRSTGASDRALSEARKRLISEAGFPPESEPRGSWAAVTVQEESVHSRRPVRLTAHEQEYDVSILGTIIDPEAANDRSFRVRLSSGLECTLVREPLGHWYVEEEPWAPISRVL